MGRRAMGRVTPIVAYHVCIGEAEDSNSFL
jgi:hypothetical protein